MEVVESRRPPRVPYARIALTGRGAHGLARLLPPQVARRHPGARRGHRARAEAHARAHQPHQPRRGLHRGRGHLRGDRPGRGRLRRAGHHPELPAGGPGLRHHGPVLRRAVVDDPGGGQRLHLRLRHPGRVRGLADRLGPHPGVPLRRLLRGRGLVGLRGLLPGRLRPAAAARAVRGALGLLRGRRLDGHRRHPQPARGDPGAGHGGGAGDRHPHLGQREQPDRGRQDRGPAPVHRGGLRLREHGPLGALPAREHRHLRRVRLERGDARGRG